MPNDFRTSNAPRAEARRLLKNEKIDTIFAMAVYHFTIHAYRSWRPDNPRGYVHHTAFYRPMKKWPAGTMHTPSPIQLVLRRRFNCY